MPESRETHGFVKIDFVEYFPYKMWISNWAKDQSYPNGFRYKVLTTRNHTDGTIEFVLLIESRDGEKEEMHRCRVKGKAMDGYARLFCKGLEDEHDIEFEEQDFSSVHSQEDFDKMAIRYGWSSREQSEA